MRPYNDNFSLNSAYFKIKEVLFRIIETSFGEDGKVKNAMDTIQNTETKKTTVIRREKLIELMKKNNAVLFNFINPYSIKKKLKK